MGILDTLKKSYSLEEAAKKLSKAFGEDVSVKNVLEFCIGGHLPLSVILRDAGVIERFNYSPLANSFRYIYEAAESLGDADCLNRIGRTAIETIEALAGLSEEDYEKVKANALTAAAADTLLNLPEQTRLKKIMEQANSLWVQYKSLGFLSESEYPEGAHFYEDDSKWVYLEPGSEGILGFDGDYQLDMTENLKRVIRDELVIGSKLVIEDDDRQDFMVIGDDGGRYTPVGFIVEDERRPEPFLSPYYLIEGLPPIETLVIQTKHLVEFEKQQKTGGLEESLKADEVTQRSERACIENFLKKKPKTETRQYLEFVAQAERYIQVNEKHPNSQQLWDFYGKAQDNEKDTGIIIKEEGFKKMFRDYTR